MTLATSLSVHPLSPTIGAEIPDIDLSVALAPDVVAAVEAPEVGGNTLWASLQDAHDGLAPVVRTPEFTCRFRGKAGSVTFWDNRTTLHDALDDYGTTPRYAHRVTLRGDRPFGPAMPARTAA